MSKKHCLIALAIWGAMMGAASAAPPLEALIVDGRMNKSHDWRATSPLLRKQLEETGLFRVDFATAPPAGTDLSGFEPDFAAYDVIVFNPFIVTFQRGAEWAATGKVTQRVPDDFPGPDKPSLRE